MFHTIFSVTLGSNAYHKFDPITCAAGYRGEPKWFKTADEAKCWAEKNYCKGVEYQIHEIEYRVLSNSYTVRGEDE